MICMENAETFGWKAAVRGMRNPMNSWDKSDSVFEKLYSFPEDSLISVPCVELGVNDLNLMMKLRQGGADDRKFMRMIHVQLDITAPLYWWKEFDTYKVGTVANSCSTMHKIHSRDLTLEDFSTEQLFTENLLRLESIIDTLNRNRCEYLGSKQKCYWEQMIQLLPSSYNQRRTVDLNYEVLANMYHARKHHKLNEWRVFCDWVKTLPYAHELIVGA